MQNLAEQNFQEMQEVLQTFACEQNFKKINAASELMAKALAEGHALFSCGNGGSMCDAMHFAEELTGRFRKNRPALRAVAISDPSYLSCVANDYGYDYVFSRYIEAWGKVGDVLLAISTSGNSTNVIQAIESAKDKGMIIIGLTGKNGGKMASICDIELRVEHDGFADRIQEVHIKIIHTFIQLIENQLSL